MADATRALISQCKRRRGRRALRRQANRCTADAGAGRCDRSPNKLSLIIGEGREVWDASFERVLWWWMWLGWAVPRRVQSGRQYGPSQTALEVRDPTLEIQIRRHELRSKRKHLSISRGEGNGETFHMLHRSQAAMLGHEASRHTLLAAMRREGARDLVMGAIVIHMLLQLAQAHLRKTIWTQYWSPMTATFVRLAEPRGCRLIAAGVAARDSSEGANLAVLVEVPALALVFARGLTLPLQETAHHWRPVARFGDVPRHVLAEDLLIAMFAPDEHP
mmetsp:Transcript_6656/g.16521  ORF Transcript_6656/g.16521 Transcript_6656/m.16521 type:complete len:276 (-) Transcript_6656:1076-1903(-)